MQRVLCTCVLSINTHTCTELNWKSFSFNTAMLGLKFKLSDALKISENTTFVFNTSTNFCHRQCCSAWGTKQQHRPTLRLVPGHSAPSLLPARRDQCSTGLHSTSSHHVYMLRAGRREQNQLEQKQ